MRKFCHKFMRHLRKQNGSSLVLVALLAAALIGMGAVVIDSARMYSIYAQMRSAVDAAALAGAQSLPDTSAAWQTALNYAVRNGLSSSEVSITTPYQSSSRMIEVTARRPVSFLLAPVLGKKQQDLTARAVAYYGAEHIFDYALFSGSRDVRLDLSGANLYVEGDVHTNDEAKFTGCNVNITGTLEAMDGIRIGGSNELIGQKIPNASFVPTPVWDIDEIRSRATVKYYGNQHFNGNILLNGIIFVDGDVQLSSCNISGTGSIIATGDIKISGANIRYQTSHDALCLYSAKSIKMSGANTYIEGILYAPSYEIQMSGANITVNGAVIADTVKISSSNVHIKHDQKALDALPVKVARLVI